MVLVLFYCSSCDDRRRSIQPVKVLLPRPADNVGITFLRKRQHVPPSLPLTWHFTNQSQSARDSNVLNGSKALDKQVIEIMNDL